MCSDISNTVKQYLKCDMNNFDLMAWRNVMDKAMGTVGLAKIEKTIDQRYIDAKKVFNKASIEGDQIIGSLLQMINQLESLGRAAIKLGEDCCDSLKDAPRQAQAEAQTITDVARGFELLSSQFLHPRVDPHVVRPITVYQAELTRITNLKKKRSDARKKYDVSRYALEQAVKRKETQNITDLEKEKSTNFAKYQQLNEDFINSTYRLISTREETMIRPYRNLIVILSQYLMQVLNQIQKFRSTFPPQAFVSCAPNPYQNI